MKMTLRSHSVMHVNSNKRDRNDLTFSKSIIVQFNPQENSFLLIIYQAAGKLTITKI